MKVPDHENPPMTPAKPRRGVYGHFVDNGDTLDLYSEVVPEMDAEAAQTVADLIRSAWTRTSGLLLLDPEFSFGLDNESGDSLRDGIHESIRFVGSSFLHDKQRLLHMNWPLVGRNPKVREHRC